MNEEQELIGQAQMQHMCCSAMRCAAVCCSAMQCVAANLQDTPKCEQAGSLCVCVRVCERECVCVSIHVSVSFWGGSLLHDAKLSNMKHEKSHTFD